MERSDKNLKYQKVRIWLYRTVGIALLVWTGVYIWGTYSSGQGHTAGGYLTVGEKHFYAEVADSGAERAQGLSERESLQSGTGLLFIFEEENTPGFWMKDMHFNIDIIWINRDFIVTDITYNLDPETYPTSFYPREPIQFVLEVNAGEAADIKIGEKVFFQKSAP